MPDREEELSGGNMNRVVRVGGTVRRDPGPSTPTIHRLLAHVRAKGLLWAPEPLGFDEAGREVLGYIPGEVPHEMPGWVWSEAVLTDVARALRAWHDATADFPAGDDVWGLPPSGPREVICHNDFAPYNCVFRNGRFAGAIDFDVCSPGGRLWDLAYTAYRFVPLLPGPDESAIPGDRSPFGSEAKARRLDLFLEAYGAVPGKARYRNSDLIPAAIRRLLALADWTADFARARNSEELAGHAAMYRAHAERLRSG